MGGGSIPNTSPETKPKTNNHQITNPRPLIAIYCFILFMTLFLPLVSLVIPKLPFDYRIEPKFEIHSITVHEYPDRTAPWNANTDVVINFTSINPSNHREVVYDNFVISVFHGDELFMVGMAQPFFHQAGDKKLVKRIAVPFLESENLAVVGRENFAVKFDGRLKYARRTFWEKIIPVTVRFEDVKIEGDVKTEFPPWDSSEEECANYARH